MAWRQTLIVQLRDEHSLLFANGLLMFRGKTIAITSALIDTGSTGTVVSASIGEQIGIVPEPEDILRTLRGVGGVESVYTKIVDSIRLGNIRLDDFLIEVGEMNYGIRMDAIIGLDFLRQTGARIDLETMTIRSRRRMRA